MVENKLSINIAMWSGPRNLSTALMRAFENRTDTHVWDEPFYAAYLAMTGIEHPLRKQIMLSGETDWRLVAEHCVSACDGAAVFYQKHMTHHMLDGIDTAWLMALQHGFLLRHPARVLRSYEAKRESVSLSDIGVVQQLKLYHRVVELTGQEPIVVDADDFLKTPRSYLEAMCEAWGLEFCETMLTWPPGPRESDGVWAPHWYGSVWQTTGFQKPTTLNEDSLPASLRAVYEEAVPVYEELARKRLRL